jgi:hypothetical protein
VGRGASTVKVGGTAVSTAVGPSRGAVLVCVGGMAEVSITTEVHELTTTSNRIPKRDKNILARAMREIMRAFIGSLSPYSSSLFSNQSGKII